MITHKYTFSSNRILNSSLNQYLLHSKQHYFIIYNPIHIYFLTNYSEKLNDPIHLVSPKNAVAYMGIRWWLSLMHEASKILPTHFNHILDCTDNAGLTMAAIRFKQPNILFDVNSPQLDTIRSRANPQETNILTSIPEYFDLSTVKAKKNNHYKNIN